jgi:hypothetical protein
VTVIADGGAAGRIDGEDARQLLERSIVQRLAQGLVGDEVVFRQVVQKVLDRKPADL